MRSRATFGGIGGLLLVLGLAASLAGCESGAEADTETATTEVPRNVRVLTIQASQLDEFLSLSGPLAPLRGTVLNAEEMGRVVSIDRDKGTRVRKGEAIVTLERSLLAAEMKAAEAALELSAYNEERVRELYADNAVSEGELIEIQSQLHQSEALAAATRIRHERAVTRAPYTGIVTARHVELGQLVTPGTPIARFVDPYVLKLEGDLTDREVAWIQEGDLADIRVDDIEEPLPGRVHWVGFEADPLTGKFPVEVRVDNADLALRPGVIGRTRVLKTTHDGIIAIPRDAVVQRPDGAVAFVEENGVARERELALGPDQGLMVIVEAGLAIGDRLLVRGQRDVYDGAAISVREESESTDGSTARDPQAITQARIEGEGTGR